MRRKTQILKKKKKKVISQNIFYSFILVDSYPT